MGNTIQSASAQPGKRAARSNAKTTPVATSGQRTFLVLVLDEAIETCCGPVVKAADEEAAALAAVQRGKADHDLSDNLDDEAAGFTAVAVYSREKLQQIVNKMELPEPDV